MPAGRSSNERATTGKRSAFLLDVSAGRQGPGDTSETCATSEVHEVVRESGRNGGRGHPRGRHRRPRVWVFGVDTDRPRHREVATLAFVWFRPHVWV